MGFLSAYSFRLSPDRMKQLFLKKSPSCYSHMCTSSDTLLESLTQQEISHGSSKVSCSQRQPTGQLWVEPMDFISWSQWNARSSWSLHSAFCFWTRWGAKSIVIQAGPLVRKSSGWIRPSYPPVSEPGISWGRDELRKANKTVAHRFGIIRWPYNSCSCLQWLPKIVTRTHLLLP